MLVQFIGDSINADMLTLKYMSEASDNYDAFDIYKLTNPTVNLFAYGSDSVHLAATVRKLKTRLSDTITLGISSTFIGLHKFEFTNVGNFANGKKVFLYDHFTQTLTDVLKQPVYTFDINSNPKSSNNDRFTMIISDDLSSTGIAQMVKQENHSPFVVFPNPAKNSLQLISGNNDLCELSIYDITGKKVLYFNELKTTNNISSIIEINMLTSGLYFIYVQTSDGSVQKIKFIKQD
jgi:hypothetical protein